jgi:hypothetical protein|nr:MAG TPA: hypothetical protein [Caudoviricetes sp.]
MTEKQYREKLSKIKQQMLALKRQEEELKEEYVRDCAPLPINTKVDVTYFHEQFKGWISSYVVRYDMMMFVVNRAKKDGTRSKRVEFVPVSQAIVTPCD